MQGLFSYLQHPNGGRRSGFCERVYQRRARLADVMHVFQHDNVMGRGGWERFALPFFKDMQLIPKRKKTLSRRKPESTLAILQSF